MCKCVGQDGEEASNLWRRKCKGNEGEEGGEQKVVQEAEDEKVGLRHTC